MDRFAGLSTIDNLHVFKLNLVIIFLESIVVKLVTNNRNSVIVEVKLGLTQTSI